MKWSIQQLNVLKNKGIEIDEMVDVSELKSINSEIRDISLVHVAGKARFSSHTVTFSLQIKGEMTLPCSRTLADVVLPFDIQTVEVFKLSDWASADEGEEIHEPENDIIDLIPYIKQNILLEIPLQIFSEGVEGEAPMSGKDWEFLTEQTKKERIDPRLADLAKFFDEQ